MSKPAPQFRPIGTPLDVPDDALNALGDKLGVPTMVRPDQSPAPKIDATPGNSATHSLSDLPPGNPSLQTKPFALGQKKPILAQARPMTEKITVELPDYLAAELRREGSERRITTRTFVMMGLQALGFEVRERDLVPDGRRARHRRNP